jgi:hypothetical protein
MRWQSVNDEPYEYAIQQGLHGNEFVKLPNGTCLRRKKKMNFKITQRDKFLLAGFIASCILLVFLANSLR